MCLSRALKHSPSGALRNLCVTTLIKRSNTYNFSTTVTLKNADVQPFGTMKGISHPSLFEGLDDMGVENMTPVQSAVPSDIHSLNKDIIVRAKTPTAKTMAYLLPAIQTLMQSAPPYGYVSILILSPTRELAVQIAAEATRILAGYSRQLEVHTTFRGIGHKSMISEFRTGDPKILIGTPQRLHDYLIQPDDRLKFQSLQTLILDEADSMLELGFRNDILNILKKLPPKDTKKWQGMCFSVSMPHKIKPVFSKVLDDYAIISTAYSTELYSLVGVEQSSIIIPSIKHTFQALYSLIDLETSKSEDNPKIIVFGNSSAMVTLYARLFQGLTRVKVYEVHDRLPTWHQIQVMTEFKNAARGILFATDRIGRGMDIPNVTLVVQVGAPPDSDSYARRICQIAQAGKADRRAIILLTEWESQKFLRANTLFTITSYPGSANILHNQAAASKVSEAMELVDEETRKKAYLSYLNGMKLRQQSWNLRSNILKRMANELAFKGMNLPELSDAEGRKDHEAKPISVRYIKSD